MPHVHALIDAGASLIWWVTSAGFELTPATGPNMTATQLDILLGPVMTKLKSYGMPYTYESHDYKTYLDENLAMDPFYQITNANLGGRLVSRDVVKHNRTGLMDTIRALNGYGSIVSGVSIDASKKADHFHNAVNPVWRKASIDIVVGL